MKLSFDDEESFKEGAGNLRFNNHRNATGSVTEFGSLGEVGSMPFHERNEDIYLNSSPSDPNSLGHGPVDNSTSTPPQERSEDTIDIIAA
jgi:hypothetical protein